MSSTLIAISIFLYRGGVINTAPCVGLLRVQVLLSIPIYTEVDISNNVIRVMSPEYGGARPSLGTNLCGSMPIESSWDINQWIGGSTPSSYTNSNKRA